ncbi:MAG: endonuclease/exonuclease/phosphatase family protein [Opitutaceae bacterium]
MAANTSSGNGQDYDLGHGIRIFQGLVPDIVLIQEFNYLSNTTANYRAFVDLAFGEEFDYTVEPGSEQIPNGVISRYPILASGEWVDDEVNNRDFSWARIDIPGDKDLWAVSVHFLTSGSGVRNTQAGDLVDYIEANVPAGDYLVVGGDFNTDSFNESALNTLSSVVETDGRPDDQNGTTGTNASRAKPYDQVLPGPVLDTLETPVVISGHNPTYSEGLVFDSRVFTPISAVSPILASDSGAPSMQHMAVIRDFFIPSDGATEPSEHATNFAATSTSATIDLSWSDVTASPVPTAYLILASASDSFTPPVDGVAPSTDTDLSDGAAQVSVNAGVETITFSGLSPETAYYFRIYPYANLGSIDYKIDGTVPALVETTPAVVPVPDTPMLGLVYYLSSTGFTATWDLVDGATGYQLDVSESASFTAAVGGAQLTEDFDSSTSVPSGWVNTGTDNGDFSGHYSSAPNCRAIGLNDTLETPAVDNPVELIFNADSSNGGNSQSATISYSIGGGAWQSLESFTVGTSGNVETIDLTSSPDLSAETNVRFRFESSFNTWYLDDVVINGAAGPGYVDGYEDKAVGDTRFHAVEGLAPDTTYYFRVRAVDGSTASENSATGTVQTSVSGTPFSVWAEEAGIAAPSFVSDDDGDQLTDFQEYVFVTAPSAATSQSDFLTMESTGSGLRVIHRQSVAPDLSWQYYASQTVSDFGSAMSEGSGVGQYQIISSSGQGAYDLVTLDVNTGSADNYFFKIEVSAQ